MNAVTLLRATMREIKEQQIGVALCNRLLCREADGLTNSRGFSNQLVAIGERYQIVVPLPTLTLELAPKQNPGAPTTDATPVSEILGDRESYQRALSRRLG